MAAIVRKHREPLPPPAGATPAATWIRESFFSTWYHTIITLALAWAMWEVLSFLVQWALIDATWVGGSCQGLRRKWRRLLGLRRRPLAAVRLRPVPAGGILAGQHRLCARGRNRRRLRLRFRALQAASENRIYHRLSARLALAADRRLSRIVPGVDRCPGRAAADPGRRQHEHSSARFRSVSFSRWAVNPNCRSSGNSAPALSSSGAACR